MKIAERAILLTLLAISFCGALWIISVLAVHAQEHDHNSVIGQFYARWMMPDSGRGISCCNQQDCEAVEHVRRVGGQLQMQRKSDGRWLTIPPGKLESNYDDARDSPDGFSHMCSRGESVYCAVLGSGI